MLDAISGTGFFIPTKQFLKIFLHIIGMRKHLFVNVFLLAILCQSCIMFEENQDVLFLLPFESQWTVNISNETSFQVNGNSFSCSLRKNNATGLVATCSACDENGEVIVGAIYPHNFSLTQENAFPAQMLYSIVMSSTNSREQKDYCISTFNWKKFEESCHELGEDIWLVDRESVMRKIARGTFKKSDLKVE